MKDVSESNAKGKKGQKNLGSGKKQVAPKIDTSAQQTAKLDEQQNLIAQSLMNFNPLQMFMNKLPSAGQNIGTGIQFPSFFGSVGK